MADEAIAIIDDLLDTLGQAGRAAPNAAPNAAPGKAASAPFSYFDAAESTTVGNTVQVTTDLARLTQCWEESELGPNDELTDYLGCIGKIMEIEEDDETIQIRWANLDTIWIPARACQDARGAEETLPGSTVSWLSPSEEKQAEAPVVSVSLFTSIEQVKNGMTVQVTGDVSVLKSAWAEAELGPIDDLSDYLGAIGKVMEVEDDDDTLQLRWLNLDTCWIPALACGDANGREETLPGGQVSWLSPSQDDGKETEAAAGVELPPDGTLLQSVNDVRVGQRVRVTREVSILTSAWTEAELGPNDELDIYLGNIGEVREIEEDDDTLQVRWGNLDTCWMPSAACYVTELESTIPSKKAEWIA